jgi:hypothetical protein
MRMWCVVVLLGLMPSISYAEGTDDLEASVARLADRWVAASATASEATFAQVGVALEGGTRVAQSPVFIRAQLAVGDSGAGAYSDGWFARAALGLESRACGSFVCAFAGIDAGIEHDTATAMSTGMERTETGLRFEPRAGFELGRRVCGRLAVGLPHFDDDWGVGLSLGVAAGF